MRRRRERNQTGWIETTASGEYQAHWYEYVLDAATGRPKRKHRSRILGSVKKMTLAKAEKELQRIVTPLNAQVGAQQDGRLTFGEFYDSRYVPLKKGKWGVATRMAKKYDMNYIRPALGHLALEEIDYQTLQMFINDLAERDFCEDVVRRCKVEIGSVLKLAVRLKFIPGSPAVFVEMPVCKATPKPTLTRAELGALWKGITDARDQLILLIGTCCALNASELFGLVWECVTPDSLLVRSTAYKGKLYEYRVKRKARMRAVPIPRVIYDALMKWKSQCQAEADARHPLTPQSQLFPGRANNRKQGVGQREADAGPVTIWSGTFLQKRIRPIALQLGISAPVTFQVLRRSFATWNRVGSLKDTQGIMGHARIETTGNVYSQDVPESERALVANYYAEIKRSKRPRVKPAPLPAPTPELPMLTKRLQ
jgi:integrase